MTSNESNMNSSSEQVWQSPDYNRQLRLVVLAVLFIVSICGNVAVFVWMWHHRRARNRIHTFIVHLCTADLLVAFICLLSHFIVELLEHTWLIGDVGCRFFKLLQGFALFSSSSMVVVIAIDRYHSVIYPFKQRLPVNYMIIPAWILAFLLSLPQVFLWTLLPEENGKEVCHSALNQKWQKQIYLTLVALVNFLFPFLVITTCYTRIVLRLWQKRNTILPGKGERRRKAKMKSLRMTFAIILVFVLCGLPYFAIDLYRFYTPEDRLQIDRNVYAVMAIFSVSHCAVNPFIFISFNARVTTLTLKYQENSALTSTHARIAT
ncbi:mesotocin receptor-like [Ptychodera flava]|uniref:mesotocin receptor-like n=1 Tax=Ptychodera flava TaxID=63121 RepID=UPI00396A8310